MQFEDLFNICVDDESLSFPKTFFQIIGRTYDEDLISRVIAYVFAKDKKVVEKLLRKYFGDEKCVLDDINSYEIEVLCEKYMGEGRADIFVEIKNESNVVATITLENKIRTGEHDCQTITYYNWIKNNRKYKHSMNAFYYLRPGFNHSDAACDKFISISYSELSTLIEADDYIINDFRQHIENNLGDKEMALNTDQINIINNYEKIKGQIDETLESYKAKQNFLIDRITKDIKERIADVEFQIKNEGIGVGSFRLYRKNWYLENEFYFYVEIRFIGGKLDSIIYQKTIKDYCKRNQDTSDIIKFVKTQNNYYPEGHYHVLEKDAHSSVYKWTESEWEDDFVNAAVSKLSLFVDDMDVIFEEFLKFRISEA